MLRKSPNLQFNRELTQSTKGGDTQPRFRKANDKMLRLVAELRISQARYRIFTRDYFEDLFN
ncbi:hypothetical protein A1D30_23655 [Acidovorax sp. GW101-3H11]|nr:hypothetical protein A1D30_23655 [Acidovorax sp. GW101-3H11]